MKTFCSSFFGLMLAGASLTLASCYAPSHPPPPRVHVTYQPPVYEPPKVAVQFVTSETGLTSDQLESRREEALRYVREQGYLRENEVMVDDATVADRILYVSPSQQIGGGFDVRVFTPGEQSAEAYSSSSSDFLNDDWDRPHTTSSITIINPRPYYGWGHRSRFYYDPFDPFFPRSSFHYRPGYIHPIYPRYYGAPGFGRYPRLAPPLPQSPRHHHPRGNFNPSAPQRGTADPRQQEQIPRPRSKNQP